MQIEIHLPRDTEAKVTIDEKKRVIILEPIFSHSRAAQSIGYVKVVGKGGCERRYTLTAGGQNGRIGSQEVRAVEPSFDSIGKDDPIEEDPKNPRETEE